MKRFLKVSLCVLLCAAALWSLSGCTMFQYMREAADKARNRVILDTPAEDTLTEVYSEALTKSIADCQKVESRISFEVKDVHVSPGFAGKDPALLDAAAGQVASLIMQNTPGAEEKTLQPAEAEGTLLQNLKELHGATLTTERDMKSEAVTDEKGNELADENGDTLKQDVVADNILKITYRYFTETEVQAENGEEGEPSTVLEPIADADIEAVFGAPRDKAQIMAEFDVLKEYLQVRDYTFTYTDPFARCVVDLETKQLSEAVFEKHLTVTAEVIGQGPLADYGSFLVTFTVNEKTSYEFKYETEG